MIALWISVGFVLGITAHVIYVAIRGLMKKGIYIPAFYYKDLSDAAKKKAREWGRQRLTNETWQLDDTVYSWKHVLVKIGFNEPDISYNISYSQGDGASFTASSVDVVKLIALAGTVDGIVEDQVVKQLAPMIANKSIIIREAIIKRTDHRYTHENTVSFDFDWDYDAKISSADRGTYDKLMERLGENISMTAVRMSKKIFAELVKVYESYTSDSAVEEYLDANMYWFDVAGNSLKEG